MNRLHGWSYPAGVTDALGRTDADDEWDNAVDHFYERIKELTEEVEQLAEDMNDKLIHTKVQKCDVLELL